MYPFVDMLETLGLNSLLHINGHYQTTYGFMMTALEKVLKESEYFD